MFYIYYNSRINNNLAINKENSDISIKVKENTDCVLCLEKIEKDKYDYNFKNNRFIHCCTCTPNLHYKCFKQNYSKNGKCIICLKNIYIKSNCCDHTLLFKISRFRITFLWIILFLFIYTMFSDIDLLNIYNIKLRKEDFMNDDFH